MVALNHIDRIDICYLLPNMVNSSEGFTWTPTGGISHGLPTIGVVVPPSHAIQPQTATYDAIVIGSGYAGLVAARDLATQGTSDRSVVEIAVVDSEQERRRCSLRLVTD